MSLSHVGKALALAVVLGFCSPAGSVRAQSGDPTPPAAVPPPTYLKDDNGREFRVRFDPGNRFQLAAGWYGALPLQSGASLDQSLYLGLEFQFRDDCNRTDMDCWKVGHEFLTLQTHTGEESPSGWPALEAKLISGRYIKYMRRPSLTLPTRPPVTFSIPFHMGMEFAAGTVQIPDGPGVPGLGLEVFQGNLLMEFWRHPTQQRALLLGVGVSYSLDLKDQKNSTAVQHHLCPFTALKAEFHTESDDGLTLFHLVGRYLPTWSDEGGWYQRFSAHARLEQVVLALNDLPVRLFLEGSYQRHMLPFQLGGLQDDVRMMGGLSWSVE